MTKHTFPVEGMTCASCVARVEKIVSKFDAVQNVSVNFATEELTFETVKDDFDIKSIAEAVEDYGYNVKIEEEVKEEKLEKRKRKKPPQVIKMNTIQN
jgi:copper chaperone CopZ